MAKPTWHVWAVETWVEIPNRIFGKIGPEVANVSERWHGLAMGHLLGGGDGAGLQACGKKILVENKQG